MDRSRVAIIIPAFNEEKTISKIVSSARLYGQVFVIDDGSKDKTGEFAKQSGAIVKRHKANLGYDDALNSGFKKAAELNYKYIITLDADGQHKPKLIRKFINELDKGASIVLGVRSKKARFAEYIFSLYTNYRYGIRDPLCGLKAYNDNSYKSVGYFDSYHSIGTELMLRNVSSGQSFKEIFFTTRQRNGKTRFGSLILTNLKILRSLFYWNFLLKKVEK